jgi:polysaccharide export outer membrane protein
MKCVLKNTVAFFFTVMLAVPFAAAQQPPRAAALPDSGYVLGPDDQIVIHAMDIPEISDKPILIGTNGNITLPLVGHVKASGLTVEQLEAQLTQQLTDYFTDPQVSVSVVEFRSKPVSVFGAVNTPGVIQLRGRKTLYEVLSMAGGPRETAGSTITVTRRRENGELPLPGAKTDPTGQFSTAELNVEEVLEGKNPAVNIEIKPNDVISVSAADSNMVYVVGDVEHAGGFTMGGRQSVSALMALSMAGGLGRTSKPDKARIIRAVPGEPKPLEIPVNLKQVLDGKAEDIAMQPRDVLVVPTSSHKVFTAYSVPAVVSAAVYGAIYRF